MDVLTNVQAIKQFFGLSSAETLTALRKRLPRSVNGSATSAVEFFPAVARFYVPYVDRSQRKFRDRVPPPNIANKTHIQFDEWLSLNPGCASRLPSCSEHLVDTSLPRKIRMHRSIRAQRVG